MEEILFSKEIGDAVSDAVIATVKDFTIGFGRAGEDPAAKGSGVLVEYRGVHGILTAAHVDERLRKLKRPIGLVRLNRGLAQQSSVLDLEEVISYAAGADPWPAGSDDISFIHIPPHLVGNIERSCSFLNADKNLAKDEPEPSKSLIQTQLVVWRTCADLPAGGEIDRLVRPPRRTRCVARTGQVEPAVGSARGVHASLCEAAPPALWLGWVSRLGESARRWERPRARQPIAKWRKTGAFARSLGRAERQSEQGRLQLGDCLHARRGR
jgi:hypothetical protein